MTVSGAPQLLRLVTLGGVLLLAGLLLGRVELVALAAPMLLLLVSSRDQPSPRATLGLAVERVEEGRLVQVTVAVDGDCELATVDVVLSPGLAVVSGSRRFAVDVPGRREIAFTVRPARWGVHRVGPVLGTAYLRGRLHAVPLYADQVPLRVLPVPERFRAADQHPYTRVLAGSHVARAAGAGVEFEGIRDYQPGDPLRRVNWRASARRGALYVTQHRPERNAEVVLFLDTFVDRGGTLDVAVRAALGIAQHYLGEMDRVGVVGFGGVLRWLMAGSGRVQLYRIVEHLLGTELIASYAWKDVQILPPRALPPRALVVALSPLLDQRAVATLADLARRGFGVVVVDTSPEPLLPRPERAHQALAQRVVLLEREALVRRLGELGVPVVRWAGPGSLAAVLAEVARLHTRPRMALR